MAQSTSGQKEHYSGPILINKKARNTACDVGSLDFRNSGLPEI